MSTYQKSSHDDSEINELYNNPVKHRLNEEIVNEIAKVNTGGKIHCLDTRMNATVLALQKAGIHTSQIVVSENNEYEYNAQLESLESKSLDVALYPCYMDQAMSLDSSPINGIYADMITNDVVQTEPILIEAANKGTFNSIIAVVLSMRGKQKKSTWMKFRGKRNWVNNIKYMKRVLTNQGREARVIKHYSYSVSMQMMMVMFRLDDTGPDSMREVIST